MDWINIMKKLINWFVNLLFVILILITIGCLIDICTKDRKTTSSPVERYKIDSIDRENNKLIIEVEHLDSIKDAKVIEVKSLDNDSTLRLFYQLIGK